MQTGAVLAVEPQARLRIFGLLYFFFCPSNAALNLCRLARLVSFLSLGSLPLVNSLQSESWLGGLSEVLDHLALVPAGSEKVTFRNFI